MDAANHWHDKYQEQKEIVRIDCEEIRQLRAQVAELESGAHIHQSNLVLCQSVGDSLRARVEELETRLRDIGDIAHAQSTGPAEPDWLWTVRELAYELL